MFVSFTKYFLNYIFGAKSRQKLVYLAVIGLVISSFALIVLQSTMGGLQKKLMGRSKSVIGHTVFELNNSESLTEIQSILDETKKAGFKPVYEYELEALIRYDTYIGAAIIHGIDLSNENKPSFIKDYPLDDFLIPFGLSINLNVVKGDKIQIISPSHTDSFMDDIPRSVSGYVSRLFTTNVPELDEHHIWTRLSLVQNLVKERSVNKIRFYGDGNKEKLITILNNNKSIGNTLLWEDINKTLVWALNLESSIMIFLFSAMTLLVSLCITSGLMIFFDKVKLDMASFWILGASDKSLNSSASLLLILISFFSSFIGLIIGIVFLLLFEKFGIEILPNVFVDRKIPINITTLGILISFMVPFGISLFFSFVSLRRHQDKSDHLQQLRSVGL